MFRYGILYTLQGTSPYPTKREAGKHRLKNDLEGAMLVSGRVDPRTDTPFHESNRTEVGKENIGVLVGEIIQVARCKKIQRT